MPFPTTDNQNRKARKQQFDPYLLKGQSPEVRGRTKLAPPPLKTTNSQPSENGKFAGLLHIFTRVGRYRIPPKNQHNHIYQHIISSVVLGVLSHHLKCEVNSPHLVDFSRVQILQNTAFGSILACVSQRLAFPQFTPDSRGFVIAVVSVISANSALNPLVCGCLSPLPRRCPSLS